MKTKLIYLATPFTSFDKEQKFKLIEEHSRYVEASRITISLIKQGYNIYSPIVYAYSMATTNNLPTDWKYWSNFLEVILPKCDILWVAKMEGWDKSTGVQEEIRLARNLGKPVTIIDPGDVK
jgi:hypothetical protein